MSPPHHEHDRDDEGNIDRHMDRELGIEHWPAPGDTHGKYQGKQCIDRADRQEQRQAAQRQERLGRESETACQQCYHAEQAKDIECSQRFPVDKAGLAFSLAQRGNGVDEAGHVQLRCEMTRRVGRDGT